jgi:hypothetical protein
MKMMMAHAVTMADLNLNEEVEPDPIGQGDVKPGSGVWRRNLLHNIAEHCNCTTSYVSLKHMGQTCTIYGHRSDIEVCKYLFEVCESQIQRACKEYLRDITTEREEYYGKDVGYRRTAANNFRRSAVTGLATKLYWIKKEAKEENPTGFGLVVCRTKKVDDWVSENFSFGKGRDTEYKHSSAGYEAGQNVNISAGGVTGNRRLKG